MSFKSMVKGHELAYVTKILAIFGAVEERQMQRLFSFLSDSEYGKIMTLLAREGQFYRTPDARYLTFSRLRFEKLNVSSSVDCFWAFLELKDRVQDFCAGEQPAIITMSAQTTDYVLAKQDEHPTGHSSTEKILRQHSLTIALMMSYNAGAEFLPDRKPSLMSPTSPLRNNVPYNPDRTYFYSTSEIRRSIQEYDPESVVKGSRIAGIIVRGRSCYCLYHTGYSRMYWMRSTEENTVASIETMLNARGFHCESFSQVVIGSRMKVAEKIAHHRVNTQSRYFTVSDAYQNCFFIVNSVQGDELLATIVDPEKRHEANRNALAGYKPPAVATRDYDAVTQDGQRPVILNYQCDLLALLNINQAPYGFTQSPILLCYDYQVDSVQTIVGPLIEVRAINEGEPYEKEKDRSRCN